MVYKFICQSVDLYNITCEVLQVDYLQVADFRFVEVHTQKVGYYNHFFCIRKCAFGCNFRSWNWSHLARRMQRIQVTTSNKYAKAVSERARTTVFCQLGLLDIGGHARTTLCATRW